MSITVRQALQLPELSEVKVVAGEMGLEREISSVITMEMPDISGYLKPGDLLLTTMYSIRDDEEKQRNLIPMLMEKHVAALMIAPMDAGRDIPAFMREQADAYGIPLLSLKYGTAFSDILDPILQRVIGAQTALLRKNADINRRMINLLIHGGGFSKIANMIHQENRLPVVICSVTGAVLADVGEFDRSAVNVYELSNIKTASDKQPVLYTMVEYKVWVCPITYANEHYATILIIIPPTSPCDGLSECQIVEQASHIIVLEVTRSQKKKSVEHRFRAEFIENIIHRRIDRLDRAIAMGREYGWDLSGAFIPVILKTDTQSFPGDAMTAMTDAYITPRGSFDGFMSRHLDIAYISIDMNYETLLLFLVLPGDKAGRALRMEILEEFAAHSNGHVWIGVGRTIENILRLPAGIVQAEQAAYIAKKTEHVAHMMEYERMGVYRILAENTDEREKKRFVHDVLGGLLSAPIELQCELLRTLKAYFSCGFNMRQAAKQLFIHHNTMSYRLAKIEELTGCDLKNFEESLDMQIALKMLSIYGMAKND